LAVENNEDTDSWIMHHQHYRRRKSGCLS